MESFPASAVSQLPSAKIILKPKWHSLIPFNIKEDKSERQEEKSEEGRVRSQWDHVSEQPGSWLTSLCKEDRE